MVVLPWYAVLCCVVAIGLILFYDILFSTAQGTLSSLFTLCLEITIDVLNCFDWKQVEQPCLISLKTSKPSKVLIPLNPSKTSIPSKLEVFRGLRDFPKYRYSGIVEYKKMGRWNEYFMFGLSARMSWHPHVRLLILIQPKFEYKWDSSQGALHI